MPLLVNTWAKFIKLPNPKVIILVEPNIAAYYVCGSDWTSEGSSTYSHACPEVSVNVVTDDGVQLTKKSSIAEVKANQGSWYFDLYTQKLYVRGSSSQDLSNSGTESIIMMYCWKHWSTDVSVFNSIQYKPIVRQDSLPPLDLAVDDVIEGMYRFNFGSFSVNNDGWFDTASDDYVWANRRVLIKIGGEALPYTEYKTYFVGRISDFSVADELVVFTVKDIRVGSYAQIPVDHYWVTDYPNMDADKEGQAIPIFYGIKTGITPVCIDTTAGSGGKWKIAGSRAIKAINEVRKNGEVLTPTTHYTTDLNNAEFTLLVTFSAADGDTLEVDAEGYVDGGSNRIEKGAAIAKDILQTYLGFLDDELDLTSFTDTDTLRTFTLDIYLDSDESSREVLQTIGRSIIAFFAPTENGKLSFEAYEPTVDPNTLEVFDEDLFADWKVIKDDSWIRNRVNVQYGQHPTTQEFKIVEAKNYDVLYKYGVRETLSLVTYLRNQADAENIAQGVLDMVSKPITAFSCSFGLKGFTLFPTRKVKVTRARAADSSGSFSGKVFRVRQVVKDATFEKTQVTALDDLQTLGEIFCYVCYSCQLCVDKEATCIDCFTCENCVTEMEGCQECYECELCVASEGGCAWCDICEVCGTCQIDVGECPTCQVWYTCQSCETCQIEVSFCTSCQSCVSCGYCVSCQVNVSSCSTCQDCVTCGLCVSCESNDAYCTTCQACYACQTNYSTCPAGCDVCEVCGLCNTCQSGVQTCTICQVCNSCQQYYTCTSCVYCQICNTAQHPVGCAVCNTCQQCVTCQQCEVCDVCVSCQIANECTTCYMCETCYSKYNP